MPGKLQSYIRANHWWAFKAAPILGFTYLYCYFFDFPFKEKLVIFGLSATTILGIAGLGYVINDVYDIEADKKAGKKNPFEGKSGMFILLVVAALILLALIPWYYLKSNIYIWIALAFQMFLFIVYAHPFTRLKEKSFWGPVCDALYGHAVPIIIACLTYQQYLDFQPYHPWWFFGSLLIWQFFKGLRNIFIHQLEDYTNDLNAGIKTLTTEKGKDFIYQKILGIILPVEVVSLLIFLGTLIPFLPWIFVYLFIFILLNIYGNGVFRNVVWDRKVYSPNTYIYFLNNFYEVYLPYFFIFFCIVREPVSLVLLILHGILFPGSISMIITDLKKAGKEIRIQADNLASRIKKFLQKKDI